MKTKQVLEQLAERKRQIHGEMDALHARLASIEEMEMLLQTKPAAPSAKKRGRPRKAKREYDALSSSIAQTNGQDDAAAAQHHQQVSGL